MGFQEHGARTFGEWRHGAIDCLHTLCLALMAASMVVQPLAASDTRTASANHPSAADQKKWRERLPEGEETTQLLNRITFGALPGDAERVRQIGVKAFLDEQLHPERIDDTAVETRVAALPTLSMTTEELVENYPQPKQPAQLQTQKNGGPPAQGQSMMEPDGPRRVIMELAQEEVLRAVYSKRQLQELMVQFWMNHFNIFAPKGADRWLTTSFERDTIRPRSMGKFEDLLVATAESPAMLFYLDNWMSATPNPTYRGTRGGRMGKSAPIFGRRPFGPPGGLGRGPFGNPGMDRPPIQAQGQPKAAQNNNRRGLNENYAREVMELHTLGVDGGYTQKDVIEVARCLTGWTIDRPRMGGEFIFRPAMHDFGEKSVLGRKIRAGHGMEDGIEVLHILAHEPATAHFIALKLCRRFVADDPPTELVEAASRTFLKSDGDIREVLKTILTSPAFDSQAAYRAKIKSPLELVASAIRGLDGKTDATVPLIQMIARMGQPMFQYQAPTGFPDRAATWINSGSLLARINFATALAANRIPGTQVVLDEGSAGQGAVSQTQFVQQLAARLTGGDISQQTSAAVIAGLKEEPSADERPEIAQRQVAVATGLLLASPEFQRR
ncbi:MAG TPA: DUF1800 domain-containing protein [Terriglobia bacterium]|nr:DUF1800 domain-containing protein [Terriglobia bacterium]